MVVVVVAAVLVVDICMLTRNAFYICLHYLYLCVCACACACACV